MFGPINESHNGYIEVYLNLGLIGVLLLCVFLITSYWSICKQFTASPTLAPLNMALWTVMLFYNMTEAAFKSHLMWVVFLLAAIAVRERAKDPASSFTVSETKGDQQAIPQTSLRSGRSAEVISLPLDQAVEKHP
jgi:O-antigen ligase